jgi:acetylornithine deacetylase
VTHPIVKTVSQEFRRVTDRNPIISGRMGAADTRFLNGYGETPSVIFGPGDTGQMHAHNQWVRLDDLISATKVLASTIIEWCSVKN